MPSPFPGMDPYLESPEVWNDFHDAFAGGIRAALNQDLPSPYYAQLGVREQVGIEDYFQNFERVRTIVPDVSVERTKKLSGAVAVANQPRAELSESFEVAALDEPDRVNFVEIRDRRSGHQVITVIEILSPSNKFAGEDRKSYSRKRDEVLGSTASLVEIDLLRGGSRDVLGEVIAKSLQRKSPSPDYIVAVQRAWHRDPTIRYQIFPAWLVEPLPVIAIPLREGDTECTLDLQQVFRRTYESGPYARGAVDYRQPPRGTFSPDVAEWINDCLKANDGGSA